MAKLSPGITFASNDYLTIAKLYVLIDTALAAADSYPGTPTLFDIVIGDLDSCRAIGTVAAPSSPATNDVTIGTDGKLDRYDGAAWVDLAVDFVYLINNSAITLVTGTPVVIDTSAAGNCNLWTTTGVCYEPFGVSGGVCNPAATAQVMTQGVQVMRVNDSASFVVGTALRIGAANATALSTGGVEQTDLFAYVVQVDPAGSTPRVCLGLMVH